MPKKFPNDLWGNTQKLIYLAKLGQIDCELKTICREADVSERWLDYFYNNHMKDVGFLRLRRVHALLSEHHRAWNRKQSRNERTENLRKQG